jgi:peroxiredoxin
MNRIQIYLLTAVLSLTSCIKEKQTGADLSVGDMIPDFTVAVSDGTSLTGAQLRDGVSCIVFFTTICPDCRETLPHVQRLYDEYADKGVRFAIISREDGYESVSTYWMEQGFTMPYSAQSDRTVYELFARTRVPRVYICRHGEIKQIFTDQPSNPSYEALKAALEGALYKY